MGNSEYEMESEGHVWTSVLAGITIGFVVGASLALLFAPKSGSETREIIKNKAGEGTDFLKQRGTEFKQTASEWVDKGKEALGRQKENLADAMEAGKQAYHDTVDRQAPNAEGAHS